MTRRKSNRYNVTSAKTEFREFKADVMRQEGYNVDPQHPDDVKYEVAESIGIPLKHGDNGDLTSEKAGKIGGVIGGSMVREMIRMAKQRLEGRE